MKIKKTYQGVIPNNKIVNTSSTSQTDTYSCDYINKLHSYSTEEQVIGKWIDGKTIYRKCIDITSQMSSLASETLYNITNININIDTLIDSKLKRIGTNSLVFYNLVYSQYINNEDKIAIRTGQQTDTYNIGSGQVLYFIIEYTKTTDTGEV